MYEKESRKEMEKFSTKKKIKPTKIKNTCLFTIFLKLAEIKIRESMKMYL